MARGRAKSTVELGIWYTNTEQRLMKVLGEQERIYSVNYLLRHVWENKKVTPAAVRRQVSNVNKKLVADGAKSRIVNAGGKCYVYLTDPDRYTKDQLRRFPRWE